FAVGVRVASADVGADLVAQLGDTLGGGVAVAALVDGDVGGGLDRRGHVELGLADAEVDRVLEAAGQVEDLADSRHLDVTHAVGDPAFGGHRQDSRCGGGRTGMFYGAPEGRARSAASAGPALAAKRRFQRTLPWRYSWSRKSVCSWAAWWKALRSPMEMRPR